MLSVCDTNPYTSLIQNIKVNSRRKEDFLGKRTHVHEFDVVCSSGHRNELGDSFATGKSFKAPVLCFQQLYAYQPKPHEELLKMGLRLPCHSSS